MHITLAYWISGLSEESPHAIHFYSIKGHACDHHKKKTPCKSSSIQIWIFGAHSWVGSRRKTRGGVLFDKTYSSLVLFPLLTRWGPIMIPVKNQSRSKDWLKTDWHAVISANSHCTVVMHFGKLLGTRLCGVIDDDAWPHESSTLQSCCVEERSSNLHRLWQFVHANSISLPLEPEADDILYRRQTNERQRGEKEHSSTTYIGSNDQI